jgi:predicted GTPase
MDLKDAKKNFKRFCKEYDVDIIEISALEKDGLERLVEEMVKILKKAAQAVH